MKRHKLLFTKFFIVKLLSNYSPLIHSLTLAQGIIHAARYRTRSKASSKPGSDWPNKAEGVVPEMKLSLIFQTLFSLPSMMGGMMGKGFRRCFGIRIKFPQLPCARHDDDELHNRSKPCSFLHKVEIILVSIPQS